MNTPCDEAAITVIFTRRQRAQAACNCGWTMRGTRQRVMAGIRQHASIALAPQYRSAIEAINRRNVSVEE